MNIKTRIIASFTLVMLLVCVMAAIMQASFLSISENTRIGVEDSTPMLLTAMELSALVAKKELSLSLINEFEKTEALAAHLEKDLLINAEKDQVLAKLQQFNVSGAVAGDLQSLQGEISVLDQLGEARFNTREQSIVLAQIVNEKEAGFGQAVFDLVDNIKTVRQDVFGIPEPLEIYNKMIADIEAKEKQIRTLRFSNDPQLADELKQQLEPHLTGLRDHLDRLEEQGDVDGFSIEQVNDYLLIYESLMNAANGYVRSVIGHAESLQANRGNLTQISDTALLIQQNVKNLKNQSKAFFDEASQQTQEVISGSQWTLWLSFAVLIILSVVAMAVLIRSITKPLHKLVEVITELSQGNLKTESSIHSGDEFQDLGDKVNGMIKEWHELIGSSQAVCNELKSMAVESKELSHQSQENFNTQQSYTQQVATTAEELAHTVKDIARCSQESLDQTNHSGEQIESGKSQVEMVSDSIVGLNEELTQNMTGLTNLNQEVGNISSILDVIRGIAEQTNLLALNAAIEAARAGEQGRGFAVVADEVRSLAERTRQSTIEIDTKITSLQSGANQAVASMELATGNANQAAEYAQQILQSFNEISESVDLVCQAATQVASASEQQSIATEEVARNITEIQQSSTVTLSHSEASYEKSQAVLELSDQLIGRMSQFRT